jgi:hypothetical protein
LIPEWWKTHTVTVEPYEGGGAHGPIFGAAVEIRCRVEGRVQLVRSNTGEETVAGSSAVSSTTVFCDPDVVIPAGSRVTVNGRVATVLAVSDPSTAGRSPLDHLEVFLA